MNYVPAGAGVEINNQPSVTKPDLSLTIQEILMRYTQGRPVPQLSDYDYHGDLNLPDVRTLDPVDREALYEYAKRQVVELTKSVDEKKKARAKLIEENNNKLAQLMKFASDYEKEKIAKTGEKA